MSSRKDDFYDLVRLAHAPTSMTANPGILAELVAATPESLELDPVLLDPMRDDISVRSLFTGTGFNVDAQPVEVAANEVAPRRSLQPAGFTPVPDLPYGHYSVNERYPLAFQPKSGYEYRLDFKSMALCIWKRRHFDDRVWCFLTPSSTWLCGAACTVRMYFWLLDFGLSHGPATMEIARAHASYEWEEACTLMEESRGRHATISYYQEYRRTGEHAACYYVLEVGEDFLYAKVNTTDPKTPERVPPFQHHTDDATVLLHHEIGCTVLFANQKLDTQHDSHFLSDHRRVIKALRNVAILSFRWRDLQGEYSMDVRNAWRLENRRLFETFGLQQQLAGPDVAIANRVRQIPHIGVVGPDGELVLYRQSRIGQSITDSLDRRNVLGSAEDDYLLLGLSIGAEQVDRLRGIVMSQANAALIKSESLLHMLAQVGGFLNASAGLQGHPEDYLCPAKCNHPLQDGLHVCDECYKEFACPDIKPFGSSYICNQCENRAVPAVKSQEAKCLLRRHPILAESLKGQWQRAKKVLPHLEKSVFEDVVIELLSDISTDPNFELDDILGRNILINTDNPLMKPGIGRKGLARSDNIDENPNTTVFHSDLFRISTVGANLLSHGHHDAELLPLVSLLALGRSHPPEAFCMLRNTNGDPPAALSSAPSQEMFALFNCARDESLEAAPVPHLKRKRVLGRETDPTDSSERARVVGNRALSRFLLDFPSLAYHPESVRREQPLPPLTSNWIQQRIVANSLYRPRAPAFSPVVMDLRRWCDAYAASVDRATMTLSEGRDGSYVPFLAEDASTFDLQRFRIHAEAVLQMMRDWCNRNGSRWDPAWSWKTLYLVAFVWAIENFGVCNSLKVPLQFLDANRMFFRVAFGHIAHGEDMESGFSTSDPTTLADFDRSKLNVCAESARANYFKSNAIKLHIEEAIDNMKEALCLGKLPVNAATGLKTPGRRPAQRTVSAPLVLDSGRPNRIQPSVTSHDQTLLDTVVKEFRRQKAKKRASDPTFSSETAENSVFNMPADLLSTLNHSPMLTMRDVWELDPGSCQEDDRDAWLSDPNMDHYASLLEMAEPSLKALPSMGDEYSAVAKDSITARLEPGTKLLAWPMHMQFPKHWYAVVVNVEGREVEVYDSSPSRDHRQDVFLIEVAAHLDIERPGPKPFQVVVYPSPKQKNGYDCGVYTLACLQKRSTRVSALSRANQDDWFGLGRSPSDFRASVLLARLTNKVSPSFVTATPAHQQPRREQLAPILESRVDSSNGDIMDMDVF